MLTSNSSVRIASWLYWLSFAFSITALTVGRAWDSSWHATHPFENFWSPPHVFAYMMTAIGFLLCIILYTNPRLARWFRASTSADANPSGSSPALELLVGSFVLLFFGGAILDFGWHSIFGLDETSWSLEPNVSAGVWTA